MSKELYDPDDLIAALATPWAESAIAVIRVSGAGCLEAIDTLFTGSSSLRTGEAKKLILGTLRRPDTGEVLDEIMAVPFRAPASYTGQDSAELYCHGSLPGLQKILALLFEGGFRQASPGEFTFRAFVNGKMDLTRAEAVQEIVSAKSGQAQALALNRLSGGVEEAINRMKDAAVKIAASFALQLDYPDDEVEMPPPPLDELAEILRELRELIATYRVGKIYQEGVVVALAGRTNAGKSSLFNLFLKEDRSIVSDIHGTTRDFLESWISLGGVPLRLYDTAGLRRSNDPVEEEGIRRTKQLLENAHIVLYLLDGTQGITPEDEAFLQEEDPRRLLLWNKADAAAARPCPDGAVPLSALTGSGFPRLEEELTKRIFQNAPPPGNGPVIDSLRQKELLERAADGVEKVMEGIHNGLPVDVSAMELSEVLQGLGEITGEVSSADILERMFSNFCVGK